MSCGANTDHCVLAFLYSLISGFCETGQTFLTSSVQLAISMINTGGACRVDWVADVDVDARYM